MAASIRLENNIRSFLAVPLKTDRRRFITNMGEIAIYDAKSHRVSFEDIELNMQVKFQTGTTELEQVTVKRIDKS